MDQLDANPKLGKELSDLLPVMKTLLQDPFGEAARKAQNFSLALFVCGNLPVFRHRKN